MARGAGNLCSFQVNLGILTIHKSVEINLSLGDLINLPNSQSERKRARTREAETGGKIDSVRFNAHIG